VAINQSDQPAIGVVYSLSMGLAPFVKTVPTSGPV
jgi:hypothetical protein